MTPTHAAKLAQDTSQQVYGERERFALIRNLESVSGDTTGVAKRAAKELQHCTVLLAGAKETILRMERENEALRAANLDFIKLLNVCAERERDSEDFFDAEINSTIAGHTRSNAPGATPKGETK